MATHSIIPANFHRGDWQATCNPRGHGDEHSWAHVMTWHRGGEEEGFFKQEK